MSERNPYNRGGERFIGEHGERLDREALADAWEKAQAEAQERSESRRELEVATAEAVLYLLAYTDGPVAGVVEERMRRALSRWKQARGLE